MSREGWGVVVVMSWMGALRGDVRFLCSRIVLAAQKQRQERIALRWWFIVETMEGGAAKNEVIYL